MVQTIALVDDDRNLLTGISIALEREGYKVQTYIDGESALIGLTRNPPDLAVVDIKMPRMDGEELLKKLKKKMSIPIIFLTSKDDEVDELYERVFRQIVDVMRNDPAVMHRGIHFLSVAKWLERIADHSTNLAEQVVFMVKGKDIRHEGKLGDRESTQSLSDSAS